MVKLPNIHQGRVSASAAEKLIAAIALPPHPAAVLSLSVMDALSHTTRVRLVKLIRAEPLFSQLPRVRRRRPSPRCNLQFFRSADGDTALFGHYLFEYVCVLVSLKEPQKQQCSTSC